MQDKRTILIKNGVRPPEDEILDVRWKARFNDWYVRTEAGWFWYDHGERGWKASADPS